MYKLRKSNQIMPKVKLFSSILLVLMLGFIATKYYYAKKIGTSNNQKLIFDSTLTPTEKELITRAVHERGIKLKSNINVSVKTSNKITNQDNILNVIAFTTGLYSSSSNIDMQALATSQLTYDSDISHELLIEVAKFIGVPLEKINKNNGSIDPKSTGINITQIAKLDQNQKLLSYNQDYYLNSFLSGAIFRVVQFTGEGSQELENLMFNNLPTKDTVLKVNMTGVTAFTRLMMRKLNQVGDPLYFSKKIGPFLKDADITHISNEVSFKQNCEYNDTVFCSDPRFIETIKDSGVDLIELSGNHNNDTGRQYNTDTINQYHQLGIATFGGGLNSEQAKKNYFTEIKGSKVAFLSYNQADAPTSGAIATATEAGANILNYDQVKNDIQTAKQQSQFVIVDVQYSECYAYPEGYLEFPECNLPIAGQTEAFHKLVDLGADMVIGTQAHQPQIYELYKDKPIYYGLGNLYFDQTQWPGTERGIILTHYFEQGKLLQTKLTPTVYDEALQTQPMTEVEVKEFFEFLNKSR